MGPRVSADVTTFVATEHERRTGGATPTAAGYAALVRYLKENPGIEFMGWCRSRPPPVALVPTTADVQQHCNYSASGERAAFAFGIFGRTRVDAAVGRLALWKLRSDVRPVDFQAMRRGAVSDPAVLGDFCEPAQLTTHAADAHVIITEGAVCRQGPADTQLPRPTTPRVIVAGSREAATKERARLLLSYLRDLGDRKRLDRFRCDEVIDNFSLPSGLVNCGAGASLIEEALDYLSKHKKVELHRSRGGVRNWFVRVVPPPPACGGKGSA
jgi:hypothetical protein